MEPSSNENQTSSLQRIIIGVGTLIVVILTVIAAIFLAMQQQASDDATTPVAVEVTLSPTTQVTLSPTSTPSLTPTPVPSDTPTATLVPPVQTTEIPATPTDTPIPPPPTSTDTPTIIVVTATSPPEVDRCPPPQNWVSYTVQAGDTLNTLAIRTNISIFDLQQANCLASSIIQPGQEIHLPFIPPSPTDTVTPTATSPPPSNPSSTPTAIVPIINNVVPDRIDERTDQNREDVIITIIGRNFRSRETGFKVELRGPESRILQLGEATSDTSFDAIVPSGLSVGTYDLVVTNPDNRAGVRESAFTVGPAPTPGTPAPPPEINQVARTIENGGATLRLSITGNSFKPIESQGFEVLLQHPNLAVSLKVDPNKAATENSFEATVEIIEFTVNGVYDLKVVNPDGQFDVKEDVYTHPP